MDSKKERFYLWIKKNYENVIKDFDKALQIIIENEEGENFKAFAFNNRGFAYHKNGDNNQALKDINHSLDLLPTNAYAYKNRGLIYLEIQEYAKACADLEKAIELGYTKQYGKEVEKLIEEKCRQ